MDQFFSRTTEATLLAAVAQTRAAEPWGRFVRQYVPMIQRFSQRWGLQEADIHDVVQETLIVVRRLLNDGKFDPSKGRFRSWLRGIVTRRVLRVFESRDRPTRAQSVRSDDRPDPIETLSATGQDEMERLWNQEWDKMVMDTALDHARQTVSKLAYRAFELYALENVPVREVAKSLGIAPSTVYVYKRRVLLLARERADEFNGL